MMPDTGDNITIWRSIAGTILGVEESLIEISSMQTGPDSGPDCLSRNVSLITRLVERCCEAIRKQRFRDPLPITVRRVIRPEKFKPWNNEHEETADLHVYSNLAWAAAIVEVEIDNVAYFPKVRGIWLVVDGGRILSHNNARHLLKLKAINALNWASREQVFYENGEIPMEIMHSYGQLSTDEIPPIHIDFLRNDNTAPKGIGELPYSTIPAAYVQAVSQAMDHPFEKIPLNAADIWEAENNKRIDVLNEIPNQQPEGRFRRQAAS